MRVSLLLLFCLLGVSCVFAAESLPQGHVFLQANFEDANALKAWAGSGQIVAEPDGGHVLLIERPADLPNGSTMMQQNLSVEKMRGCRVGFSARVKAENVSKPPQSWNGVKFMAPLVSSGPSGKQWPQASIPVGTFGWQSVNFSIRVPEDAESLSLALGLEAASGKVWFDDVRVGLMRGPIAPPVPRETVGPVYRGHDLPRLRGAMIQSNIDPEGLRTFGRKWNANVIRWQLTRQVRDVKDPMNLADYDAWLESELVKLDKALPICREAGLYVVVDLHSPPGGRPLGAGYIPSNGGLFDNAACQAKFVDVWRKIARRYKDVPNVWGYDLINEPLEDDLAEGMADWPELATRAARAVHEIDPRHAIIVEPAQWANADGFKELRPVDVPNVVYSFHMYMPLTFTHQGVYGSKVGVHYPSTIDGVVWDKAQLAKAMQPARDFQKAYGAHIYVGEFSAIRWAPDDSAYRYLKDAIDLFESYGWDWTYHAFREWSGWSVEHGSNQADDHPSLTPTSRQLLLQGWYEKNRKPLWTGP